MARKVKHEEHENHERWLISYADFITLLFAFFVVMYSLSSVNEGKFRVLAASMAASFRGPPSSTSPIQLGSSMPSGLSGTPNPQSSLNTSPALLPSGNLSLGKPIRLANMGFDKELEKQAGVEAMDELSEDGEGTESGSAETLQKIAKGIAKALLPLIKTDLVKIRKFRYWLEVEIKTSILFSSGSAEMDKKAIPVLQKLASILLTYPNPIRIEGFTDNVPIMTYQYPSNWELSSARAFSVLHLFITEGMEPIRLAAVGHGEYKPAASNNTIEGRQQNRRVVIVVLADEKSDKLRTPQISGIQYPIDKQQSADGYTGKTDIRDGLPADESKAMYARGSSGAKITETISGDGQVNTVNVENENIGDPAGVN
jgi:chemotaxis protein MotB